MCDIKLNTKLKGVFWVPGQDANVTGTHPFAGHVSHSVVLGTIGAGAQDETNNPDIGQVCFFSRTAFYRILSIKTKRIVCFLMAI